MSGTVEQQQRGLVISSANNGTVEQQQRGLVVSSKNNGTAQQLQRGLVISYISKYSYTPQISIIT